MTKKALSQYRGIVAEIQGLNERINNNTLCDTVVGSDSFFPFTQHAMSVTGMKSTQDNMRVIMRRNRLEQQKKRIEDFVENIADSEIRQMLDYRYIIGSKPLKWLAISKKISPQENVREQYAEMERLQQKLSRFFKKI